MRNDQRRILHEGRTDRDGVGTLQKMGPWIAISLLALTGSPSFAGEANIEPSEERAAYVSGRLTPGPLSMPDDIIEGSPSTAAKRKALFGDMHVHTTYSFDAFAFGTLATPYDAY